MSGTVGIDVGSGGVRAVMLDDQLQVLGREERALPPGSRTAGGGHRLDESVVVEAARAVLDGLCRRLGERPEAVAVCGTAGTLCLHDGAGLPAAAAVAYDDHRHGTGLERVRAWHRQVPRVVGTIRDLARRGRIRAATDGSAVLSYSPPLLSHNGDGRR